MDEFTIARDRSRAVQASAILENELIQEAYKQIEADLMQAWAESPARDNDGRERLWMAVQANRKHKDYLQTVLARGKMAEDDLNRLVLRRKA